jgi:hypothetical protein
MTGSMSKPSSLFVAVPATLLLALAVGSTIGEFRSGPAPLSDLEAARIVGGQASCNRGYTTLETLSAGCDGITCPKMQNAAYTATVTSLGTVADRSCYNAMNGECGVRQSSLPVCTQ